MKNMLQELTENSQKLLDHGKERLLHIAGGIIKLSKIVPALQKLASSIAKEGQAVQEKTEELEHTVQEVADLGHHVAQEAEEADLISQKAQDANRQSRDLVFAAKRQLDHIASAMEVLNQEIHHLSDSTKAIEALMDLIRTVALQTRLLSLNASVEAARAGATGKGFAVIANEIRALSEQTGEAARQAMHTLSQANQSVSASENAARTVHHEVKEGVQTGLSLTEHFEGTHATLEQLISHVQGIARLAKGQDERLSSTVDAVERLLHAGRVQAQSAKAIDELAREADQTSESLLLAIGRFRLPIHDQSKMVIESFLNACHFDTLDRFEVEKQLEALVRAHPYFELVYVTNHRGIQISDNIAPEGHVKGSYGSTGLGEDWSSRPWFKFVCDHQEIYISDLYRSVATNNYCFTVAAPIFSSQRKFLGVLAVDIHFDRLLSA